MPRRSRRLPRTSRTHGQDHDHYRSERSRTGAERYRADRSARSPVAAALITMGARQTGVRFDFRALAAFVLFYAFGILCCGVFGHYGPRELGAFWPIYFMLFYCIAGLWFGRALVIIGVGIIVLTLIGYFFVEGGSFLLWMAAVNGGGLILSGLWMRRVCSMADLGDLIHL